MNFFKKMVSKDASKSSGCCGVEIKEVNETKRESCCGTSNEQQSSCC
jgi:hypothetical protein